MLDRLTSSVQTFFKTRALPFITIFIVTVITTYRHFALIHYHAVNLLYWDQWDYYMPMFRQASWWELFNWQNGVHRQGIGFWLTKVVADLSGWDTRVEAFFVGGLVFAAMLVAIWLKYRLFGKFTVFDLVIPLTVLTTAQFQIFAGASNPSPQAFPLLLLFLFCLAWTISRLWLKYLLVAVLNFILLYTGYGLLMGLITPLILAINCYQIRNDKQRLTFSALTLAIAIVSIMFFLHDYVLSLTAILRAEFWQYPAFMVLMFARFVRPETGKLTWLSYLAFAAGLMFFLIACSAFLTHLKRTWQGAKPVSPVIVIMVGYCLLFTASTSFGRAGMGLNVSQSSRYVTLMIPSFLGLYFHLLTIEGARLRQIGLAVFLVLLLPGHLPVRLGETHPASYFSRNKHAWKDCYLRTENAGFCDQLTGFRVIGSIDPAELNQMLNILKLNRLNFYKDYGGSR